PAAPRTLSLHDALPISSSEYLLLDDQPASVTPYTEMDVRARMTSTPGPTSAITTPRANGMTAGTDIAMMTMSSGASEWIVGFAARGRMSSFMMSFSTSAKGCRNPAGPTRLGPGRSWM